MHSEPRGVAPSDTAHRPSRATILVVDDEESILLMLKDILEDEAYMVVLAKDGQEAFNRALENRPALILTDVMMPVMDGHTLSRHLRAEPRTAHIPLIAMSAAYRVRNGDAFDAVIAKPFDIDPLLDIIRTRLDGSL